jgi:hypothetical protein
MSNSSNVNKKDLNAYILMIFSIPEIIVKYNMNTRVQYNSSEDATIIRLIQHSYIKTVAVR